MDAEALAALTAELIRAESPDPPGDERRVAAVVAGALSAAGLAAEVDRFAPDRANVLARLEGAGERPALVFSAHMDTLPAGEGPWTHPPFAGVREGRWLYGRGACDMKSGLAAMIAAAASLRAQGTPLAGDLLLAFTGGESSSCLGARRLVETGALAGAGALLVSEPSSLELLVAEKAALWLRITAHGAAGHLSARDGGGRDAIAMMTTALPRLPDVLPGGSHPLLGAASLNVGRIVGGTAINLTPDRCIAELDLRLLPEHDPDVVEGAVRAALGEGFGVERLDWKPAVDTSPDAPFAKLCGEVSAAERGAAPRPGGAAYFSDACVLAPAFDLPMVIIGPGALGGSGAVDEHVDIDDLRVAARLYREIARRWLA